MFLSISVALLLSSQKPGLSESCFSSAIFSFLFATSKKPPYPAKARPQILNFFCCHKGAKVVNKLNNRTRNTEQGIKNLLHQFRAPCSLFYCSIRWYNVKHIRTLFFLPDPEIVADVDAKTFCVRLACTTCFYTALCKIEVVFIGTEHVVCT